MRSTLRLIPILVVIRLVSVGGVTVDEAYEHIRAVVSNDNDAGIWLWSPLYYIMPEVLLAFGFIEDTVQPNFVLEQPDGTQVTYNPPALTSAATSNSIPTRCSSGSRPAADRITMAIR